MAKWSTDKPRWWLVFDEQANHARIEIVRAEHEASAITQGCTLGAQRHHAFIKAFDHEPVAEEIAALGLWR